jgi:hypothetical protein
MSVASADEIGEGRAERKNVEPDATTITALVRRSTRGWPRNGTINGTEERGRNYKQR